MTFLKPHKNHSFTRFIAALSVLVAGGGMFLIFAYSAVADARYEIDSLRKKIVDLQAENADVKELLFKETATSKLKEQISTYGLRLERNPEYLNEQQWLSDSSR